MDCEKHPKVRLIPVQMENGEIVERCMMCDLEEKENAQKRKGRINKKI